MAIKINTGALKELLEDHETVIAGLRNGVVTCDAAQRRQRRPDDPRPRPSREARLDVRRDNRRQIGQDSAG